MKILYHHRTLGDGAEGIHIQAIVNCLRRLGHKVKVVSLIGERTQFRSPAGLRQTGWDAFRSKVPGRLYELAEIAYNLRGLGLLLRAIKRFSPDLVYDRYAHYSFSALWAARIVGLPLLLEVNTPYSIQKELWEKLHYTRLSRISMCSGGMQKGQRRAV